jgi:hypothetical protein
MPRVPGRPVALILASVLVAGVAPGSAQPPRTSSTVPSAGTASATATGTASAAATGAAAPAARPVLAVDRARAARLCEAGVGSGWGLAPRWKDDELAAAVMRGRFPFRGGTLVLARNPSWRPQPGLDRSGDNGQHGLHWAMPLLREGMRTGDARMVNRFYGLILDWARDNPRARPVSPAAWEDYQVGRRLLTLVCAAAGPRGHEPAVRAVLATHLRVVSAPSGWHPVNNASLLSSAGLLAAGCIAGDRRAVAVAVSRFRSLGARLYKADGSDDEGAPAYTYANYLAQAEHDARMRICGVTPPREVRATARMPHFLAAATRPDGALEAIGDGGPTVLQAEDVRGTAAEHAATRGASGRPPAELFARFAGGYVFGRSGWGTRRPFGQETFYSVRTGAGNPRVLHGHADQTALTFFSHGAPLLVDSGVYRYARNAARAYVTSRRAHTSVTVAGLRSAAPAVLARTRSGARHDLVTMQDRSYAAAKVRVRRDVFFSRTGRWMLVLDAVSAPRAVRVDQRWQLRPGRGTSVAPRSVTSTGSGADVALRWLGRPPVLSVARGLRGARPEQWSGWNSAGYGRLTASATVQASASGRLVVLATVVLPVAEGEAVSPGAVTGSVRGSTVTARVRMPGGPLETVTLVHGRVVSHTRTP